MDGHYAESLDIGAMAAAAGYSRAHFSREFRRVFAASPRQYLITRRLERAAALLRNTDRSVAAVCHAVGLTSVGSFTAAFGRTYGMSPTSYRAQFPPAAAQAVVPVCIVRFYTTPVRVKESEISAGVGQVSTNREVSEKNSL
ncbi:helix-turn-helix transcriptional regulator [Skermania sp. ID1734]|uniref:helix-turn-helix transcriptional regulator n=1 Tax=Skermania sp. ID1734 TaxID=2597516 RepID=UPI00117D98CE|nr:helix-turn-helix transcriptional regulator [Skermania sp. ID1734]TSD99856.1 helix-turn-helix transcriptional regulator [Skermania sp. ID1734]